MRLTLFAATCLLSTIALAEDESWTSYSADGKATLRQAFSGGGCTVTCTTGDGAVAWTSERCLAHRGERRFVSADCERAVVLIPAPLKGGRWDQTEVMRVYTHGKLEYAVTGVAVIPEAAVKTSPSWLKGCFGVSGAEPHYAADGRSVDYEMVDGKPGSVPLVAEKTPEPSPTPAPSPKRKKR
jgi:hypothetical protein